MRGSGVLGRRAGLLVTLLATLLSLSARPADALTGSPITCTAAVSVTYTWQHMHVPYREFTLNGSGSCVGGFAGPYWLSLTGYGDDCVGIDYVAMATCGSFWRVFDAELTLLTLSSGSTQTFKQYWSGDDSFTTTPFGIQPLLPEGGTGLLSGAGVYSCKDPAFQWVELHDCPAASAAFTFVPRA